ncbi:hypothetical protein KC332_g7066 [Hortaea werneckii]|nr:hypothetical protein KC350_g10621 [Hortaea werneckii]KAI6985386.1 hypothetical protein KC329_g6998 [Hortaea werneckii]KAI7255813.1 hypothetical protein KC335_g13643 [Hortaea werneckii]KAI7409340.1 hypothetical protein KC332_g7066 [Hortaea werneckii]KAI7433172.1 hypothetical protein KC336_g4121 [Hortaea werneckii]
MTSLPHNRMTVRDLGYTPGQLPVGGPTNSILDVPDVHISQVTAPTSKDLMEGSTATKGITVISPRPPEEFYKPCHAGTFTFNGNGELTGSRQIANWGFINTPIAFTNSLSLGTVFDGMWDWVMDEQEAMGWDDAMQSRHYGTPVVGETCDWIVNSEVRRSRLENEMVMRAFRGLHSKEDGAEVVEGQAGGGAGMTCHMFAGGTGTASRLVGGGGGSEREYTLSVLCQSNYGVLSELVVGGVPIGKLLQKGKEAANANNKSMDQGEARPDGNALSDSGGLGGRKKDGSILILMITDAPLATHQLQRLARHATGGLVQVGSAGVGLTFSGDIFLAVSTAEHGPEQLVGSAFARQKPTQTYTTEVVKNESIDSYFVACKEAVEEAILNSMVGGRDGVVAMDGSKVEGLPIDQVKDLLQQHLVKV